MVVYSIIMASFMGVRIVPNYDFRCKNCGNKFTVMVSISEKDKVTCPECDSKQITQLFTSINVKGAPSPCGSCSSAGTGCSLGPGASG